MNRKQSKRLYKASIRLTQGQPEVLLTTKDGRRRKFDAHNVYRELKRQYLKGELK
jgi:hypothetical protein